MLASVTPSAALLTIRDAILAFVAGVAGLPDELSIWAEAASRADFIVETSFGLKPTGEIFFMLLLSVGTGVAR